MPTAPGATPEHLGAPLRLGDHDTQHGEDKAWFAADIHPFPPARLSGSAPQLGLPAAEYLSVPPRAGLLGGITVQELCWGLRGAAGVINVP